jgi:heterotetrameric sarcosine oxidase gamma subunit
VSAPELVAGPGAGVRLASYPADIVEIAALREGARTLRDVAAARAESLPACGRITHAARGLILSVRPERWLCIYPPAAAGVSARSWQAACAGCAAAVDLSSALTGLYLSGRVVREVLRRGCRLDLDPQVFPAGTAAATFMAQVPVILAALGAGLLLLTPSSTARHLREWLAAAAKPFGLMPLAGVTVASLSGEKFP